MMINFAYCECMFESFAQYKCHLKILHNKQTYGIGNKLMCGQNGCPREFGSFQALEKHCIKQHRCQQQPVDSEKFPRANNVQHVTADCTVNLDCSVSSQCVGDMCSIPKLTAWFVLFAARSSRRS